MATAAPPVDRAVQPAPARLRTRRIRPSEILFGGVLIAALSFAFASLAVLLYQVFSQGWAMLDGQFLQSYTSRMPERAGIRAAVLGSVWVVGLVALIAFPLGVGAAVHLEEFAPKNRLTRFIEVNIANLAAVPSVVYGMLGLAAFVRFMGMGRSILAAALTLSLLVLPIIIVASREALRAVPSSIRQGGLALGATRWEAVRSLVLPAAFPGILTGTILALSRALGEAAPLIVVGAAAFIATDPRGVTDQFTVLPIQIFNWTNLPAAAFKDVAAAGIIVMMVLLLVLNGTAIFLRNKFSRKW
jgi:phosphate transport system permease protein